MYDFELNYLLVLICLEKKISVGIIKQIYINNYLIQSWLKDILIYLLAILISNIISNFYFSSYIFFSNTLKKKSDVCI